MRVAGINNGNRADVPQNEGRVSFCEKVTKAFVLGLTFLYCGYLFSKRSEIHQIGSEMYQSYVFDRECARAFDSYPDNHGPANDICEELALGTRLRTREFLTAFHVQGMTMAAKV